MKYGFIGTGNMAQTMIKGFIGSGRVSNNDIYIYDIDKEKQNSVAKDCGTAIADSPAEIISKSEVVVLAVKPYHLSDLLKNISEDIKKCSPILLSLPAGIKLKTLNDILGFETPIIRIMPNICAEVFASVTALCANKQVAEDKKVEISESLKGIGEVIEINESYFDIFTVIASSAPAFMVQFSEALADAALKEGLPKPVAREIIYGMMAGSAKMLQLYNGNPNDLKDKVSSPGGTTIEGLLTLTETGFETSVHSAVKACMNKLRA